MLTTHALQARVLAPARRAGSARALTRLVAASVAASVAGLVTASCGATNDPPGADVVVSVDVVGIPSVPSVEPEPATTSVGFPPEHPMPFEAPGAAVDPGSVVAKPVITSVDPNAGSADGGEIIVIRGQHFTENVAVLFGEVSAPLVFFVNDTWLNVTTPPGNPGAVDVLAINPDGNEGRLEAGFRYEAALSVTTIAPSQGHPRGGDAVTIRGTGFVPGVKVLIGDRMAPVVTFVDGTTLTALTPPGALGRADVRVLLEGDGVAELSDGFQYVAAPEIAAVEPLSGPTAGGTVLTLTGRYFTADASVTIGAKPGELVDVDPAGTWLRVRTPGDAAGRVGITATTLWGDGSLDDAFVYVGAGAPGVTLWNVVPASGPVAGGTTVTLVVSGLKAIGAPTVLFGSATATVDSYVPADGAITVTSPPGLAGAVQVTIVQGSSSDSKPSAFTYTTSPSISAVGPSGGAEAGGEAIMLAGAGLAGATAVTIGGVPAPDMQAVSDGQVAFISPPCSPGYADVVVTVGGVEIVVADGYFCRPTELRLLALEPGEVARCGGSLVQVIGTGFPDDAVVRVGGQPVFTEWGSPTTLWIRSPKADPGPLDVVVSTASFGLERALPKGLVSFDPENRKAAIWGPHIERTVNATIIDGGSGAPIPGATAILGADAKTAFQCTTDERGQCTISAFGLGGKQTITAAKVQFSAYSIAGFDGQNATLFLRQQAPPGQAAPPGDPGTGDSNVDIDTLLGTISGRVEGIGKYAVLPPPSCDVIGSPDGAQCLPCVDTDQCAPGLTCSTVLDTGSFCLKGCLSDSECSTGYRCATVGKSPQCVPTGGKVVVRCDTSRRSFFGGNPDPGPGAQVDPDTQTYTIDGRLGEVTVYCMAGYTSPSGVFIPTIMGIRPTVIVHLGESIVDADVTLDIPLTRTLRARLIDLPYHRDGITDVYYLHALDLGAEGWIPMPEQPAFRQGDELFFYGFPESLEPFGPSASYTFYAAVNATTSGNVPSSNRLLDVVKSIDADPILERQGTSWAPADSGMRFDLSAVYAANAGDVWAVGQKGRVVHKGALGWGAQPKFTSADLHTLAGRSPTDLFAGGDRGTILHFDGITWTAEPTPVTWAIRAISATASAGAATAVAVGDGGILRRGQTGAWQPEPVLHGKNLLGVATAADGRAFAVGRGGKVLRWDGGWKAELVADPSVDLRCVLIDGQSVVAAGTGGIIATRAPSGTWTLETVGRRSFNALTIDPLTGDLVAVGDVGAVYRRDSLTGEWVDESPGTDGIDLRGVAAVGNELLSVGASALPIGPWMAFPLPINPTANELLEPGYRGWSFEGQGAEPTFNQLFLVSTDGFNLWTVISDGVLTHVDLPSLTDVTGYDPIPSGTKYFNLLRILNPDFNIDGYRFNQFGFYKRTAWSLAFGGFY